MVLSLPRSGSTWASVWLSTETVQCIHDPLWRHHYSELDHVVTGKPVNGISCTGLWRWTKWVNAHPARKVIIHRDPREINASLKRIGYPLLPSDASKMLRSIDGMHVRHEDLFFADPASRIWEHLTQTPFDIERHRNMVELKIEPKLDRLRINYDVQVRLGAELNSSSAYYQTDSSLESMVDRQSH